MRGSWEGWGGGFRKEELFNLKMDRYRSTHDEENGQTRLGLVSGRPSVRKDEKKTHTGGRSKGYSSSRKLEGEGK